MKTCFEVNGVGSDGCYIQMGLKEFMSMFFVIQKNLDVLNLVGDERYIIRICQNGTAEIGYIEDDWKIK